jgi:hypothetical protein
VLKTKVFNVDEWAQRFIGKPMSSKLDTKKSPVKSYRTGDRGQGVWFILEDGREVYRQYHGHNKPRSNNA